MPIHSSRKLLFLISFLCCTGISFAATMPPINMKVIDADTNQPLAGVNVLFHLPAHKGTFTGHGGENTNLLLMETVTNAAGEISFSAQDFSAQPFILNTNYHNPRMIIFKPGYSAIRLINNRHIVPELKDVTNWEHDKQIIKLRRTQNNKEIYQSAHTISDFIYQTGDKDFCWWTKMPRLLVAADQVANEWNAKRQTVEEKELKIQRVRSLLQDIMQNEKQFAQSGCAPKKIFETYLSKPIP